MLQRRFAFVLVLAMSLVAAAAPAHALDLSGTTSFDHGSTPNVAPLPGGEAMAVWWYGPSAQLRSATRSADGTWGPYEVAATGVSPLGPPQLAVDGDGDATVVWLHNGGSSPIKAVEKPAGGTWSAAEDIYTAGQGGLEDFSGLMTEIHLAGNPSGDLAVAFRGWAETLSGDCEPGVEDKCSVSNMVVALGRKPDGSDWQDAIRMSSRSGWEDARTNPRLALDRAGNATVAWAQGIERIDCPSERGPFYSVDFTVQARSVTNDGVLQPLQDVGGHVCGQVHTTTDPDVAVDWYGNRTLVFAQTDHGLGSLRVTSAPPGANFPAGAAIWENTASDGIADSTSISQPRIGIAARDATTTHEVILARRNNPNAILAFSNSGSGWSNPTELDDSGSTTVQPTFDRLGNAYAAWNTSEPIPNSGGNVRSFVGGAVRKPGGGWSVDDVSTPHDRASFGDQSGVADLAGAPASASADFVWQDAGGTLRARRIGGGSLAGVAGNTLRYIAGTGQQNDLTITDEGDTFRVVDVGGTINPADGCTAISANVVRCSGLGVTGIHVELADGDDRFDAHATVSSPLTVTGGTGDDTLLGSGGADELYGEDGTDVLRGRGGGDVLDGGTGGDTHDGGGGEDTLSYAGRDGSVAVKLDGDRNDGADPNGDGDSSPAEEGDRDLRIEQVVGGRGADRIVNNSAASATIRGGDGDDVLRGGNAADSLFGNGGDDVLDGRFGGDTFYGGPGSDTVTYATRGAAVRVALDRDRNDGAIDMDPVTAGDQGEGDFVRDDVENVTGGSGDDILAARQADAVVNVLAGGLGADRIITMDGTRTRDRAVCGGGIDTAITDVDDRRSLCEA